MHDMLASHTPQDFYIRPKGKAPYRKTASQSLWKKVFGKVACAVLKPCEMQSDSQDLHVLCYFLMNLKIQAH